MDQNKTSLEILSSTGHQGSLFGFRMPCLAAVIRFADLDNFDRELSDIVARLEREFKPFDKTVADEILRPCDSDAGRAAMALGLLAAWILNVVGVPSVGVPQLFRMTEPARDEAQIWRVYLPSLAPYAAHVALKSLCEALTSLSLAGDDAFRKWLNTLNSAIGTFVPSGVNNREMIRAAMALNIPVTPRADGIWQYGYGHKARIFSSSLTEHTPSVGVRAARSKSTANRFLREAGIPVPRQITVTTETEAATAVQEIGFPVVVKPADLDGGLGVSAGLKTKAAARLAYLRARQHSKYIVIESHISGQDYRINVFNDQVMLVGRRVPASVVGDGKSTISALVAARNLDPRRRPEKWFQMKPIALDKEALEMLSEGGMTQDSIPDNRSLICLRRAANVSSGGEITLVTDQIHPENRALAIRAARALRLDLAGIDLITKDIARPWYQDGGAICEVNAQVQFGFNDPTQYGRVISGIVEGDGRIPIVVVLTTTKRAPEFHRIHDEYKALQHAVGFRLPQGAYIGVSPLIVDGKSAFQDVRSVLANTEIGGLVVVLSDDELVKTGLPFDQFDILIVDLDGSEFTPGMRHLLRLCGTHCSSHVLLRQGIGRDDLRDLIPMHRLVSEKDDAFINRAQCEILKLFSQTRKE